MHHDLQYPALSLYRLASAHTIKKHTPAPSKVPFPAKPVIGRLIFFPAGAHDAPRGEAGEAGEAGGAGVLCAFERQVLA